MFNSTSRLLSLGWTPGQHAQLLDLERKTKLSLSLSFPLEIRSLFLLRKLARVLTGSVGGTGPVPLAMLTFAALLSLCFWIKSGISAGLTGECLKKAQHYTAVYRYVISLLSDNVDCDKKPVKIRPCSAGSKCGTPQARSPMAHSLRVIGGAEATYGSHPWLVSGQPSLFDLLFYHREPCCCQQRSSIQICPDRSCLQTH